MFCYDGRFTIIAYGHSLFSSLPLMYRPHWTIPEAVTTVRVLKPKEFPTQQKMFFCKQVAHPEEMKYKE